MADKENVPPSVTFKSSMPLVYLFVLPQLHLNESVAQSNVKPKIVRLESTLVGKILPIIYNNKK